MADETPHALDAWLKSGGPIRSYEALGKAMNVNPTTITRAVRGLQSPSMKLALDIEVATQGTVTATQFLEICADATAKQEGRERPLATSPELSPSAV